VTPNRGDCLSHLGIAREIAAYYDFPVHKPVVNLKENEMRKMRRRIQMIFKIHMHLLIRD